MEKDPNSFESHLALGNFYLSKQRYADARTHLETAARLRPDLAELRAMLGNVLLVLGHLNEAEQAFREALQLEPENLDLILGMATIHRSRGHFDQALASYRLAARLRPKDPQVLSNLAAACLEACEPDELIVSCDDSARRDPEALSHLVSALNYQSVLSSELVAAAHRAWGKRCMQRVPSSNEPPRRARSVAQRLRLGFVGKDFCQHPVGRYAAILFSRLDRDRFQLFVYDNGSRNDSLHERMRALVPNWRSIAGVTDEAAFEFIERDEIDVLVDLAGHTLGNRLSLFAHRPAPVQVTVFAYPNTTGLEAIQYRITDPHADPPGLTERLYVEKPLRLSRTAWVYVAPAEAPAAEVSPVPAKAPCVFGCLNNPMKLSGACVKLWGAVLARLPGARLRLLAPNEAHRARLISKFVAAGAASEQIHFVPGADLPVYLGYHHGLDLMLDPFPYNGGVTTCDALWMGVPVLTLAGDSYLSRQGVSILSNVGLVECIAATREEFLEKAVAFATGPGLLAEARKDLRSRLRNSPLMDYANYLRELSDAFARLPG